MPRYRKRRRASRNKNLMGAFLIFCVVTIFILLAFFRYQLQENYVLVDPKTLCPTASLSPKYVALVFDKSDAYNPVQKRFLKRFFNQFKDQLQPGTHISVYLIGGPIKDNVSADFVVCAPRTGKDANAFYENPRLIRQRWQQQFEQPLDKVIDGFMQASLSDSSPIMEALQVVSLSAFPVDNRQVEKQIILVSDMLQHTPEWSHYRGQMKFSILQKSKYYQKINTDLQNAEVNILYVRREGMEKIQNKRHAFFWADYIESIGGQVTLIEKIDG